MGKVAKFLFAPVGLGGMGVDLTESRPLEFYTGPKQEKVEPYNENTEKEKVANMEANKNKKRVLNETQTVLTNGTLGGGANANNRKTLLGG